MADKRKKGECYFCSENFEPSHKCASKGVFLMELADNEDTGSMTDDIEISLHALTCLSSAKTMQLRITIVGIELRALVDSGSTHTFIHDVVAHRLGLQVKLQSGLSVKVVNGERLQSYGACRVTTLTIQDEQFVMDCYTLQWLRLIGPLMWDFAALSMAFIREGRSV
jgi:hypothetical protein